MANPKIQIQAFSDILRWRLLANHGGLWVDATLYCCRPLGEWLASCRSPESFFAFRTCESHVYHSWLLYGRPSSSVVVSINYELDRYWIYFGGHRSYWDLRGLWRLFWFLEQRLGPLNQEFWRSRLVAQFFRVYPYFINMYLMGPALRLNARARKDFLSLTQQFGDTMHDLQRRTAANPSIGPVEVQRILEGPSPVQKLTTKRYVGMWERSGVLSCLDQFGRH